MTKRGGPAPARRFWLILGGTMILPVASGILLLLGMLLLVAGKPPLVLIEAETGFLSYRVQREDLSTVALDGAEIRDAGSFCPAGLDDRQAARKRFLVIWNQSSGFMPEPAIRLPPRAEVVDLPDDRPPGRTVQPAISRASRIARPTIISVPGRLASPSRISVPARDAARDMKDLCL